METGSRVTLVDMFRAEPARSALVTVVPLVLALAQLANSVINELSVLVSVPFALVVVGYACVLNQHGLARFRRRRMERELHG